MVMSGWRKARNALGLRVCVSPQLDNPEELSSFGKDAAPTTPPSAYTSNTNNSSMNMIEAAAEVNRALENLTNLTAASSPGSSANNLGANGHSTAAAALLSPRFSSKLHLMRNALRSSRSTCAICLEAMKAGNGHALFTAECSHSFHFACIASNVRHGNLVCPVCRATWKDVPWQAPSLQRSKEKGGGRSNGSGSGSGSGGRNHDQGGHHHHHHHHHHQQQQQQQQQHHHDGMRRSSSVSPARRPEPRSPDFLREALRDAEEEQRRLEPVLRMLDESIANFRSAEERQKLLAESEPATYDDDEALDGSPADDEVRQEDVVVPAGEAGCSSSSSSTGAAMQALQITTVAEESEVVCWQERDSLTVLVHVNAAAGKEEEEELARSMLGSSAGILSPAGRRAAVDLVAVLDVSGSMAGVKLSLLKRAMALVVRSLGPADRLSIVAFASRARRVMPLRRMSDDGRRAALQAVDGLACTGGTNISDGLRRGTDVLQQRRHRNPVATIMLLSDGQDTYTMRVASPPPTAAASPTSSRHFQIPVHTFGLGVDHDAGTMHTISEESGGTFSFVQGEGLVQDAFAQCLGGLLSVVALRVEVEVMTADPSAAQLVRVESGSYLCSTVAAGRQAVVHLGDLYAHEERDLLVELRLPALSAAPAAASAEVLYVRASYKDPVSGAVRQTPVTAVAVRRPAEAVAQAVGGEPAAPCVEVDRHRNRLHAARAIVEARSLADVGDLAAAQRGLEAARQRLQGSAALASGDKLSAALDAELARIQASMSSRHAYRTCGRAYALSAQSSHMRQRATMRSSGEDNGDGYRTPSMNSMLQRSRALVAPPPLETAASAPSPSHQVARRLLQPPSVASHGRRRHILEPRPGSRLARLASFDSVIRP